MVIREARLMADFVVPSCFGAVDGATAGITMRPDVSKPALFELEDHRR